jgi:(p)ppGpp synthase/HD superfamily hydrolase
MIPGWFAAPTNCRGRHRPTRRSGDPYIHTSLEVAHFADMRWTPPLSAALLHDVVNIPNFRFSHSERGEETARLAKA